MVVLLLPFLLQQYGVLFDLGYVHFLFRPLSQYIGGTTADVEKLLLEQKEQSPNRIPYMMCKKGPPGFINLMYLPGRT